MNYIIKGVLRRVFTLFLDLEESGVDLSSGVITLPKGSLSQAKINSKLAPVGLRVVQSQYKNLTISALIIEIMSKPVRVSIELLEVTLEMRQKEQAEGQIQQEHEEQKEDEEEYEYSEPEKGSPSYFQSILNQIIYGVELLINCIKVRLVHSNLSDTLPLTFYINELHLKNTIAPNSKHVRKTLTLGKIGIEDEIGGAKIEGMSVGLQYQEGKLGVIGVVDKIGVEVNKINLTLAKALVDKKKAKMLKKKNSIKKDKEDRKQIPSSKMNISVYFKITQTQVVTSLASLYSKSLQLRLSHHSQSVPLTNVVLNIHQINLSPFRDIKNAPIVSIGYLDDDGGAQVKAYPALQEKSMRHCRVSAKIEKGQINGTVYHLKVKVDADQAKLLIDELANYTQAILEIAALFKQLSNQNKNPRQVLKDKKGIGQLPELSLTIYRFMIEVCYSSASVALHGTTILTHRHRYSHCNILSLVLKAVGYRVLTLQEIQAKRQDLEVVVIGSQVKVQTGIGMINRVKAIVETVKRDIAYYSEKFKDITHFVKHQENINELGLDQKDQGQEQRKQKSSQAKLSLPFERLYFKLTALTLSLGSLFPSPPSFISLIDLHLLDNTISLVSPRISFKTNLTSFLSSPYTLHRTPLTNQLQINLIFNPLTTEFSLTLKNQLIILVQDYYFNIVYRLLDGEEVWCQVNNMTHLDIAIEQEIEEGKHTWLYGEGEGKMRKEVKALGKSAILWLHGRGFSIIAPRGRSRLITLSQEEDLELEITFGEGEESLYLLKASLNRLQNLTSLTLDYRARIAAYEPGFIIHHTQHEDILKVPQDSKSLTENSSFQASGSGRYLYILDDLPQEYKHYKINKGEQQYLFNHLTASANQALLGLYQVHPQTHQKMHQAYLLRTQLNKNIRYAIMPFLILQNKLQCQVKLTITDKKTQQKQQLTLQPTSKASLGANQHFDYCMRQLTIQIDLSQRHDRNYQSQGLYFNTFFMVDHHSQTPVLLRATQRQDYSKRALILEESLLLRTKLITIRSAHQVKNRSGVDIRLGGKQSGQISVSNGQSVEWNCRLRQEMVLDVGLREQPDSKVQVKYGTLRQPQILSFNFCKINDKFYNVLLRADRRGQTGHQTLEFEPFVELVNLCRHSGTVFIDEFEDPLPFQARRMLPLNATSLSKYNNRAVDIDDLGRIYAEVFLTAKVTDRALTLTIGGTTISFSELLAQGSTEVVVKNGRTVLTLLKDMSNGKIVFYLTDRLSSSKAHLTLFNNQTDKYFLLADDGEYIFHFTAEQPANSPPEKIFIPKKSTHCLLNRQNYDLLLCDENEQHLGRPDRKALQKEELSLQQYNFDSVSLIDCDAARGPATRRQIITRGIQVRLNMGKGGSLVLSLKSLAIRWLQKDKIDILVQDVGLRNEQTQDHLLRIPEETYLLVEGKVLREGHYILIRHMFVKCRNIIVNIRRSMPYALASLLNALSERVGGNTEKQENVGAREYKQRLRRKRGEEKLRRCVNEAVLLLRHFSMHEAHLSLSIQLQGISFSNAMILPEFQTRNRCVRAHAFTNELSNHYLTNLLAKFPKLSFLMSSFKSPLSALKLFFNIRQALRERSTSNPVLDLSHSSIPVNPFHFSVQRWNHILAALSPDDNIHLEGYMHQAHCYLIVTSHDLVLVQGSQIKVRPLKELESARIARGRRGSELGMTMKKGEKWGIGEEHKECVRMLNTIQRLLL